MSRFLLGGCASAPVWLVSLVILWAWLDKPYDDQRHLLLIPPLMLLTAFACYRREWLQRWVLVGGIVSLVAAILVPGFLAARAQGQITLCKRNLRQVAQALENAYAQDGHYPASLAALTPARLRTLPTCPTNRGYDYAVSYELKGTAYTMRCRGHGRRWVPDYPGYSSRTGLLEAPYREP